MSLKDSDEAAFYETSACFPEEEWNLLHEWQKALYRNVMKEINRALISLGPLIATTVCSLIAKEKEEMSPMDTHYSERRNGSNCSPGETMVSAEVLFRTDNEEQLLLHNPQESEARETKDRLRAGSPVLKMDVHLRKEEPNLICINDLGAEIRSGCTDHSTGYEVVSLRIKEEEDVYCVDDQDCKNMEILKQPTGNQSIKRKKTFDDSIKCTERTPPRNSFSAQMDTAFLPSTDNESNQGSQMWSDCYQEIREDRTAQCDISFTNPAHFSAHQGSTNVGGSDKYNECESMLRSSQFTTGLPAIQQNPGIYRCNEDDNSYNQKGEFTKQIRPNSRERPYACTECDKSFFQKTHLITHHRIHSGEKPYMCTFCHKRFNRKDYLDEHIRIHTGERPYKCTKCEKSFSRKCHLNEHHRKHIQSIKTF